MSTKKRRRTGRIFQRKSRLTGELLPTWWIAYRVDGKEVRESAHSDDYAVADTLLTKRKHELNGGAYVAPDRERLTLGTILDGLLANYVMHWRASLRTLRGHVATLKANFGAHQPALALTTQRVAQQIVCWQERKNTPATINRRLAALRRAYRLAKLKLDPIKLDFGDLLLQENSPRGRYISPADFQAIHVHLPPYLQPFVEFAYLVGKRKGQLARTTWANWSQDAREFTWQPVSTKNRRPEVLPLDGRPLEIVERLYSMRRLHCPYVFHGPDCAPGRKPSTEYGCVGHFKKEWSTACKAAGFPVGRKHGGFVFHNTRHSASTNLVNAGVSTNDAMEVTGHRTRSVFDRYKIAIKEQTRRSLHQVSEVFATTHPGTATVTSLTRCGQ